MIDVAEIALLLALALSLYSALASLLGFGRGRPELLASARRGVVAVLGLLTLAAAGLAYALATRQFGVRFVAEYSRRDMDPVYTVAAFYAGNAGSLLFLAWVLSILAVLVVYQTRTKYQYLWPYANTVLLGTVAFFVGLVVMVSNPFERAPMLPGDGQGLNPALENTMMFLHPLAMYVGYAGFAVPFALSMAALATGQTGNAWVGFTRRWALLAWSFLTLGNLVGGWWAYTRVDWGGYWAWDPVENGALILWLTGTAYLHSVLVQERWGTLRAWNVVLVIAAFVFSIFGTYLARSRILSSIHSFGEPALGPFFVALIALVLVGSFYLLLRRLPGLRSDSQMESFASREGSFLANNLLLLGAGLATLLGTVFPLVTGAVRGARVVVGSSFFNQVNGPIFVVLLLLMGICPLLGWRRVSPRKLLRLLLYPVAAALVAAFALHLLGVQGVAPLLVLSLSAFVTSTVLSEFIRGVQARRRTAGESHLAAAANVVRRNKTRYGGYVVHLGVIMVAAGVVGSTFFSTSQEASLSVGQSVRIGGYALTFEGLSTYRGARNTVNSAALSVSDGDGPVGRMAPERNEYPMWAEPESKVAIRTTFKEDLYIILAGFTQDGLAVFKILVYPLVVWIWIGGGVLMLGAFIAFWPNARGKRPVDAPMVREGIAQNAL
ncbi:MAG TPA: cytochrome c-type biogenesis CcmF C-terminal domain-containing protein [Dehalococcoidia bacterium]|nr:cytochrome c-type biogenesis CcmF C-terminal domain-containing protein [Dehalococcoidia bacterium]